MSNAAPNQPDGFSRAQWHTLSIIWVTYGTFYLCRVNIGSARTGIQDDLSINPLEMGLILGALKIGYAFGQLINGLLAERFGAKRILMLGMFGSVTASLLFAFSPQLATLPVISGVLPLLSNALTKVTELFRQDTGVSQIAALLLVLWLINGYCQAGGWPPCVKVMSNWFTVSQRGRMMGIIGTSYQFATAVTLVAAGLLIDAFGGKWQMAFIVPAAAFLLSALHTGWRLREQPQGADATGASSSGAVTGAQRMSIGETLRITLTNPRIWIVAFGLFGLDIVRYGFLDWAPGHLKEVQGTGISGAALKTAVLPLGGILGALVSGWVTDRFFQSRRAPVIAGALFIVGVLTLTYDYVVQYGWLPTVICLGVIGFFIYGAQILLVGTAAQDFARRRTSAAAAGFIDFMGYIGAFTGAVVTGWLLLSAAGAEMTTTSYQPAIHFWAGTAFVASLLVATLWRARPLEE